MAPPGFSVLGKQAREIFAKGYHIGNFIYDIRAKGPDAEEINAIAKHDLENNATTGTIEVKKKLPQFGGLTLSGKWTTNNDFYAEVTNQDYILQGVKVSSDVCYSLNEGCKGGHIKAAYDHDACAANLSYGKGYTKDDNQVLLIASAVVGSQPYFGGILTKFDLQSQELAAYEVALAYVTSDLALHSVYKNSENTAELHGYHKITSELEGALAFKINVNQSSKPKIECGVKYALDGSSALRAKFVIDNMSLKTIGLGYQHKMTKGVTLYFSAALDAGGGDSKPKVGLAVELDA